MVLVRNGPIKNEVKDQGFAKEKKRKKKTEEADLLFGSGRERSGPDVRDCLE